MTLKKNHFRQTLWVAFQILLWSASPQAFSSIFPSAHAANAEDALPILRGFQPIPERVSPVTLAYARLAAILKAHGNRQTAPFVLPIVSGILSDPFSAPLSARDLTCQNDYMTTENSFETKGATPEQVLRKFISDADKAFSLGLDPKALLVLSRFVDEGPLPMNPLVDWMAANIMEANIWVEQAFSHITTKEKNRLYKLFPRVLDEFVEKNNLSDRDASVIVASAQKVRMMDLLCGVAVLSKLFSEDFLTMLRRAESGVGVIPLDRKKYPGLKGRFTAIRETPAGLILIGDRGPNVYGMEASLIIDLGGDDVYLNNAGAPVYEIHEKAVSGIRYPSGIVIDFEGNDRYLSPKFAAVASGFFGLGIILDMAGNDFYDGDLLSEGASFFGMGCLMDMAGDDTYVCREGGQGCAFFGGALLFDGNGNDLYQGAKYVQGFGGPLGLGKLNDLKGTDHYRAGWKHASHYGTKNVYQACSQGVGWGFRGHAAGGIGILHDFDGDDSYEAGNFAQGTGYFLGMGVLRDNAGNDVYAASRYCQGAAAHRAVGAFLDFKGNDVYSGKIAANQGAAWDLSVGCFLDNAGNDSYSAGDLSLGAGAQNAVGLFYDGEGNDRYQSPPGSLGFSGSLSYGDGRNGGNLGIFLDVGGGNDDYAMKGRRNSIFRVQGNMEMFLDE